MLVNAQTSKEAMIDSIASTIMNGKGINLIETTLNIRNIYRGPNIFATEIALYRTQKEALSNALSEVYADNTAEELRQLHNFISSDAYKRLVSFDIEQEYMPELIASAITSVSMQELKRDIMFLVRSSGLLTSSVQTAFTGTHINKKDYIIKDKEFVACYDRYFNTQNKEALSKLIARQIDKIYEEKELGISRDNILSEALNLYPNISKNVYYMYISKEQMQYIAEFYESPIGQKFTSYAIHSALNLYAWDRIATIEAEAKFKDNLKNIKAKDYKSYIAEREKMSLAPLAPIKNIKTIEYLKGSYTGMLFDDTPHGQGVYTTKEGVKYSGDFVDGKMHGRMTVYSPAGDSIMEMWANGKKMKEQSLSKPTQGAIKNPPTYTDRNKHEKAMGYGYQTRNGVTNIGMFVDGLLHGEGTRHNNSETSEGTFHRGFMLEGTIQKATVNMESTSKGTYRKIQGSNSWFTLHQGSYVSLNLNDSCTTSYNGTDILGWYNGNGKWQFDNKIEKFNYKRQGYFAYDGLFGDGEEIFESNETFRWVYKGYFVNTKKSGKGNLVIESKNTFNDRFSTFYDNMAFNSSEEINTITLDGTFDNDKFIEGRITLSCGDWYEGKFRDGELVEGRCCVNHNSSEVVSIANRDKYEGEIKNGKPHGEGKLVKENGRVFEGTFMDGKYTTPEE